MIFKKEKINIIELFTGIGSPRKALNNCGIKSKTLFISEINPKSISAYNAIFNDQLLNIGNICNYDPNKILKFKNQCDILFSGSPCQDFSQGGKNLGGEKLSKTRSSLIWESVKMIELIKPKIVVFENVKNLVTKHQKVLDEYIKDLSEIGYHTAEPIILNAKNFGIPQNRDRVFVVSFLNSPSKKDQLNIINWNKLHIKMPSLESFLKINNFSERHLEDQKIEYKNWTNFCTWKAPSGNINGSYNRAWKIEKYCGTLNVCNVIKITDGEHVSKLTPLESWMLMGFSKQDYNKVSKLMLSNDLYKLSGNSIVVDVLKVLLNEVLRIRETDIFRNQEMLPESKISKTSQRVC